MTDFDTATGILRRPLESFGTSVEWLRGALTEAGVRLHPASALARALDDLGELRRKALEGALFSFKTTEEAYAFFANAEGADFLSKALHWGASSGLRLGARDWALLASGDPIVTKVGLHSTERNRTWELIIASLASTFAKDVVLEEPDVCCRFKGRTFAVSAKVAYSEKKLFSNVEEGFAQANGRADGILVFGNVVNLYPVVETLRWSRFRQFQHNDEAVSVMRDAFTRWCDRFELRATRDKLRERARQAVGVAFFVPMLIHMAGQPIPFHYTHLPVTWAGEKGVDYAFAKAFLESCNHVLDFRV